MFTEAIVQEIWHVIVLLYWWKYEVRYIKRCSNCYQPKSYTGRDALAILFPTSKIWKWFSSNKINDIQIVLRFKITVFLYNRNVNSNKKTYGCLTTKKLSQIAKVSIYDMYDLFVPFVFVGSSGTYIFSLINHPPCTSKESNGITAHVVSFHWKFSFRPPTRVNQYSTRLGWFCGIWIF